MKKLIAILLLAVCVSFADADPFRVKPYLQLGDNASKADELTLLWQTGDADADWSVEVKAVKSSKWVKMNAPEFRRVAVRGIDIHRVYSTTLTRLKAGEEFDYQLLVGSNPVFTARAKARKKANQPYRFVLFGDCAQDTPGQREVAYQTYLAKPDFVFIAGDIVYSRGLASEYNTKFFPIYNAEAPSATDGAPLLRSTPFIAATGNHDTAMPDLLRYPDGLAYFYYWNQPLNGPLKTVGAKSTPILIGGEEDQKPFLAAAGPTYPQMANFSFDYGNAHWTVLDSNKNVNWTDPALIKWVTDDLQSAQSAKWRFVAFHHPGFNSSIHHLNDQWMRGLSSVFEKGHVNLVFAGHVHNYQRSFPLTFEAKPGGFDRTTGVLNGEWTLDKAYDGKKYTKPSGIIYLVSGAGGANVYDPEQETKPETWLSFTDKFVCASTLSPWWTPKTRN